MPSENVEYIRPVNSAIILYRGMLHFADEEGMLAGLAPEYIESLKNMNMKCQKEMDGNILAETMHWVIRDTRVSDLAAVLAGWLRKNFDIKLKSG